MDDEARTRWIAAHILPCEGEIRRWLRHHARTLPAADFDDLLQEAYARIWSSDLARIANARGYFYTIVRHLLLEQARRARIVPMERMAEIESLKFASDEPGPEHRVTVRQELENLILIVATLPAKCRAVFNLRSFDGCSRREIAERMNISERTVEHHLAKAHERIADAMSAPDGSSQAEPVAARKRKHDGSK